MFKTVFFVSTLVGLGSCYISHSDSSSQYIHSNDTIKLFLSKDGPNQLYGLAGSMHNLEFVVVNDHTQSRFSIRQSSEDGFVGVLPEQELFLGQGQQQKISVNNMRVPNRPEGSKIKFTLTVERQSNFKKREAPPTGDRNDQESGSGGSGSFPGGSGGYSGGNNNGYQQPNYNDPSFRMKMSVQIEFTVTAELDDEGEPDADIEYMPDMNGQYCPSKPGEPNCIDYFWWVKITTKDEKSGLNSVAVEPEGKITTVSDVYYRYENWAVGTNKEYMVAAAASCCVEKMTIRITDVAGNTAELRAKNGEKGSPMKPGLMWGLIGGGIALVLIILIVVFVCYRKNYSPVSTGD